MKTLYYIFLVLGLYTSQTPVMAWEKVEGFVEGPSYYNPDLYGLIIYTNVFKINQSPIPLIFDYRGPGPSNVTLSNEVLSLQLDLFDKNDVIRTNITYDNIPKEFTDKIADKSIFFNFGYDGNIYAIDKNSRKTLFSAQTNEFIYTWTQFPQSNLVAYTIFDNQSTNKESMDSLRIVNTGGILITNIFDKEIHSLGHGPSYWMGDNIFKPSQGRVGARPMIYNIQSNKILFSETFQGMPRLIHNQIVIYNYPNQKDENDETWTETSFRTDQPSTKFIEQLAVMNEVNYLNKKTIPETVPRTSNIPQVKMNAEPFSVTDEKLYFGVTKRNLLSALMIAGGGALLVMTLLYAFWPRQK